MTAVGRAVLNNAPESCPTHVTLSVSAAEGRGRAGCAVPAGCEETGARPRANRSPGPGPPLGATPLPFRGQLRQGSGGGE